LFWLSFAGDGLLLHLRIGVLNGLISDKTPKTSNDKGVSLEMLPPPPTTTTTTTITTTTTAAAAVTINPWTYVNERVVGIGPKTSKGVVNFTMVGFISPDGEEEILHGGIGGYRQQKQSIPGSEDTCRIHRTLPITTTKLPRRRRQLPPNHKTPHPSPMTLLTKHPIVVGDDG